MPNSIPVAGPGGPPPHCHFCCQVQDELNQTQPPERFHHEPANRSSSDSIYPSNEIEMRWEHTLTIRMVGRMTTFGSRPHWIFSGKRGRKVYGKIGTWIGNGTAELNGMDHARCKLTLWGEFWTATWVWSGEHMKSYEGFEIVGIGWNGWLIIIVREVAVVFRREMNCTFAVKSAAV